MAPPIVQLAVAYGAGLWVGLVFLIPAAVLLPLGAVAALVAWRFAWPGTLVAALTAGLMTGVVRAHGAAGTCRAVWPSGRQAATLAVHDASGSRGITTGTVLHVRQRCGGTVRLRTGGQLLPAGSRVVAVGLYRSGGVLRVAHVRVLKAPRSWRFQLRDAIAQRVRRLYGERAGFVEALVLGRRDDIAPTLRKDFADAGLAHLLAISGLHVGIVAMWLLMLARRCGARHSAWLWSFTATWLYVGLLGFPAPATRAAAFVTIYGVARLRQRHPPPSAVLAVAVLVVMAIEPAAVTAVGAWLSVAAVWGTRVGTQLLPTRLRRSAVPRLAAASAGATVATAPITAYVFGTVAPAGLVANLVAVPLAAVVVPGVFGSLVTGGVLAGGTGLALAGLERVAAFAADLPGGHLTGTPGFTFAAPWAVLAGGLVWVVRRRPRWVVIRARLLAAGAAACWVLFALAVGAARDRGDELAIYVLDVGQGDAIAVRTPRGRWLLVDGGPRGPKGDAGRSVVVPFLRSKGARKLAAIVVSHGDADHLGGIPSVLRSYPPELVLEPAQPLGSRLYLEYLAAVDGAGIPWRPARVGDTLTVDSVSLTVMHPSAPWIAHQLEPNENSVVLRLSYGCLDAILAGDIGWPAESALVATIGEADLLKVGHHGSAGSTTSRWLDAVRPKAAVVSVGLNSYGHPAEVVLQRLAARGVPVWRTDRGGTVTIRTDGRYLQVVQGQPKTLMEKVRCQIRQLSRSSGSSWSRSGCTRKPPVSLPACSTISPSRRR